MAGLTILNKGNLKKYFPRTNHELRKLCRMDIPLWEIEFDKNIKDVSSLFYKSTRTKYGFEGIQEWDFSQVEDISSFAEGALFFDFDIRELNLISVKRADFFLRNTMSYSHSLEGVNMPSLQSAMDCITNTNIAVPQSGSLSKFALEDTMRFHSKFFLDRPYIFQESLF